MNIAASPGGDVPLWTAATLSISATRVDPGRGTAVLFELHPERRHCDASSTNILYGNDKREATSGAGARVGSDFACERAA